MPFFAAFKVLTGEPAFLSEGADFGWAFVLCKDRLSEVFVFFLQRKWAGLSIGQEIDGKSDGSSMVTYDYKSRILCFHMEVKLNWKTSDLQPFFR